MKATATRWAQKAIAVIPSAERGLNESAGKASTSRDPDRSRRSSSRCFRGSRAPRLMRSPMLRVAGILQDYLYWPGIKPIVAASRPERLSAGCEKRQSSS